MSDPIYAVLFHVRATKLAAVLGALDKDAVLVSVVPTQEAVGGVNGPEPKPKQRNQQYVNGKRLKGISGEDLVLKTLTECNGLCRTDQLRTAFAAAGFKETSFSSPLSYLVKKQKVRYIGDGKYALFGHATIHLNAGGSK